MSSDRVLRFSLKVNLKVGSNQLVWVVDKMKVLTEHSYTA